MRVTQKVEGENWLDTDRTGLVDTDSWEGPYYHLVFTVEAVQE